MRVDIDLEYRRLVDQAVSSGKDRDWRKVYDHVMRLPPDARLFEGLSVIGKMTTYTAADAVWNLRNYGGRV